MIKSAYTLDKVFRGTPPRPGQEGGYPPAPPASRAKETPLLYSIIYLYFIILYTKHLGTFSPVVTFSREARLKIGRIILYQLLQ